MEADAVLRQMDSDRLQADVQLLALILDEYRAALGLEGQGETTRRSLDAAARRLAQLPAGQWLVNQVYTTRLA